MYNQVGATPEIRKRLRRKRLFSNWSSTVISFIIAFIPTWFFILIKFLLEPEGFWQNFAVYGVGFFFLGGIQLVFLFIWLSILVEVIWN